MKTSLFSLFILGFICMQCSTGKTTTAVNQQQVQPKESSSAPQFISTSENNEGPVDSTLIKKYGFTPPKGKQVLSRAVDTGVSAPINRKDQKDDLLPSTPKK